MMFLTSCSQREEQPRVVREVEEVVVKVPEQFLICLPEPIPNDIDRVSELMEWVGELTIAGRDCRSKLEEVRNLLMENDAVLVVQDRNDP